MTDLVEVIQLKPCPFCGGRADIVDNRKWHDDDECWMAACPFCGGNVCCDTEAEAITAWNTRSVLEDEVVLEALEGLADVLEHDCECPPCIGSMAPAEHYLGLARAVLAKVGGQP